jgi:hypothetical protein
MKFLTRRYWMLRRAQRILQHTKLALWNDDWWNRMEAINTITRLQWEIHDEQVTL